MLRGKKKTATRVVYEIEARGILMLEVWRRRRREASSRKRLVRSLLSPLIIPQTFPPSKQEKLEDSSKDVM